MKPAPTEPAELLNRVRQQLILAQVRLMQLEDECADFGSRLINSEKLMTSAQNLADQKTEDASHLTKVHGELQAQFEHLRHMQHVTNEALNTTRTQLAATAQNTDGLQRKIISLVAQSSQLNATLGEARTDLTAVTETASTRLLQLNQLESELTTLKASRSWRWTKVFRWFGHFFAQKEG